MGWASGSILMSEIVNSAKRHIKDKDARTKFYEEIITAFEDQDCDTLDECTGVDKAFDEALESMEPEKFEE